MEVVARARGALYEIRLEKECARIIIVWPISHINSFDFFSKANGEKDMNSQTCFMKKIVRLQCGYMFHQLSG